MLTDYKLYNSMMGREINLRHLDLSSVTRHHNYKMYLNRLMKPGDDLIPKIIKIKNLYSILQHMIYLTIQKLL